MPFYPLCVWVPMYIFISVIIIFMVLYNQSLHNVCTLPLHPSLLIPCTVFPVLCLFFSLFVVSHVVASSYVCIPLSLPCPYSPPSSAVLWCMLYFHIPVYLCCHLLCIIVVSPPPFLCILFFLPLHNCSTCCLCLFYSSYVAFVSLLTSVHVQTTDLVPVPLLKDHVPPSPS